MFSIPALVARRSRGDWAARDKRRLGTNLCLLLAAVVWLASGPRAAVADESESWICYAPEGAARPVVRPIAEAKFYGLLAENDGGYVAVWDDSVNGSVIVEHQSPTNTQTWQQTISVAEDEGTRVVLASTNRVLWCSPQRWVFLDRENGQIVTTGTWNFPLLDPEKIIIRDDIMYVIKEESASGFDTNIVAGSEWDIGIMVAYRFDTNMTALGAVSVAAPQGVWASYAGSWLLDLNNRSSHSIRVVSITTGVQTEIPLPTDLEDGFTEHRVLSANDSSMFVLSSINWPETTLHYFTLFNADGILFQRRMSCQESFTGVTALTNGWLVSTRSLAESTPKHHLFRVDPNGNLHAQMRIEPATPQNYIALNTEPPRVLHVIDGTRMEIIDVTSGLWWQWWLRGRTFFNPAVETLQSSAISAPIGSTGSFWLTPICPNIK